MRINVDVVVTFNDDDKDFWMLAITNKASRFIGSQFSCPANHFDSYAGRLSGNGFKIQYVAYNEFRELMLDNNWQDIGAPSKIPPGRSIKRRDRL